MTTTTTHRAAGARPLGGAMFTTTAAQAGTYIATEVAWHGSANEAWIASRLAAAGFDFDAATVVACAVEAGLLRPIPRLGGYTVSRKVNAEVFGETFAEWVAA